MDGGFGYELLGPKLVWDLVGRYLQSTGKLGVAE